MATTRTLVRAQLRGDKELRRSLNHLQRDMNAAAKAALLAAAEKHAVPAAKRAAPSLYARNIVAFATTRGCGVTVKGAGGGMSAKALRRTAGYLEHGGTIRAKHQGLDALRRGESWDKGDTGYLVFKVNGQWVRVRSVSRPIRKRGRYILPALMSDRIRRRVMRQLNRELTPKIDRIVRQGGGTYTPATAT